MTLSRSWLLSALLLTAGCTRTTLIVIAPPATIPVSDPACAVPPPGMRFTATEPPAFVPQGTFPPQALRAGIRIGCAGVMFHIDASGHVTDPQILVENPLGYGFGEITLQSLPMVKFQPHPHDENWHYGNFTERATAAPVRPPGLPGPTTPSANPFRT